MAYGLTLPGQHPITALPRQQGVSWYSLHFVVHEHRPQGHRDPSKPTYFLCLVNTLPYQREKDAEGVNETGPQVVGVVLNHHG